METIISSWSSKTQAHVDTRSFIQNVEDNAYSIVSRINLSINFALNQYYDLAVGEAYMALLLCDELEEDSEFNSEVLEANDLTNNTKEALQKEIYQILCTCLQMCGNLKTAYEFCTRAVKTFPDDSELQGLLEDLFLKSSQISDCTTPEDLRDYGLVRREVYPWNTFEPNRNTEETVRHLNKIVEQSSSKLEVKLVELPFLRPENETETQTGLSTNAPVSSKVTQLGLFAKEDLLPGEIVLDELSLITSCARLNDTFCDACNKSLSSLADASSCEECNEVVFCSPKCQELSFEYHPAICGVDVTSIAKDVPDTEVNTALYTLLLFRTFSMAISQSNHPLDLPSIRYIWGDFNATTNPKLTLPFSFQYNVLLPLNFLEKALDQTEPLVNIFTCSWSHVWVFNTLFAKFRGTASAKQGPDGKPEVGAVHPVWCLANHSCDPNVTWDWDGGIKFKVVENRANWKGRGIVNHPGIKAGDEILSHYCDIELNVNDRRGWAKGALGGVCCCDRCLWECRDEL